MATIPLYNEGRETRSGIRLRPVLAPTAAPKITAPQVTGDQVRSFAQPLIDARPHVAAAGAIGYAGEAAMRIGEVLGKYALAKMEVRNRLDVADAEDAMTRKLAEYERWKLESPDPRTWEQKWGEMSGELPGLVLHDRLSPAARDAIQERLTRFQGRAALRVGTDAAKQMFAIEGQRINAGWMRLAADGDYEGATAGIRRGVELGHMGEDDAVRMEYQAKRMVEESNAQRLDGDVSAAHEDVAMAWRDSTATDKELAGIYGQKIDSTQGERIRARGKAAVNRGRAAFQEMLSTQMLDGRLPSDEDLEAARLARLVDADDIARIRQWRVDQGQDPDEPKRMAMALEAIGKYDPGSDESGERELELKKLLGTLGKDAYAVAAGRLAAHLKPGDTAHGVPHARDFLRMMWQGGAFGNWRKQVEVEDPKRPGERKVEVRVDQEEKQRSYRALSQALDAIDAWGDRPENKHKGYRDAVDFASGLVPHGSGARSGALLWLGEAGAAVKDATEAVGGMFGGGRKRLENALSRPRPEGSIEVGEDLGKNAPKPERTELDDKRDEEARNGADLPERKRGRVETTLWGEEGVDGTTVGTGAWSLEDGDELPALDPLPGSGRRGR